MPVPSMKPVYAYPIPPHDGPPPEIVYDDVVQGELVDEQQISDVQGHMEQNISTEQNKQ
jgi:hypothetical protein